MFLVKKNKACLVKKKKVVMDTNKTDSLLISYASCSTIMKEAENHMKFSIALITKMHVLCACIY